MYPSSRYALVRPAPIPCEAPVMIATFPLSGSGEELFGEVGLVDHAVVGLQRVADVAECGAVR
jgi:hypothetical protein